MRGNSSTAARRAVLVAIVASASIVACTGARRTSGEAPAPKTAGNTLTDSQFRGQNVARVEELFAGRFPGVEVYAAPGGFSVRVRGASSFLGSTEPLYIIDGMPVTPGPGGLISLNPSDVAKIEVLKDAASLAEYGSRGGNGVVRITTKGARSRR